MLPFNENFAKTDSAMYDAAETVTENSEKLSAIDEQIANLTRQLEAAENSIIREQTEVNIINDITADAKRFNTETATIIDDIDTQNDTNISDTNSLNAKYNEYIKFSFGIVYGEYGYYKGDVFVSFKPPYPLTWAEIDARNVNIGTFDSYNKTCYNIATDSSAWLGV